MISGNLPLSWFTMVKSSQGELMFLCSYLNAWGSPYNLKTKFWNMEHGLNFPESKVLLTKFAGRYNQEMALCLEEKGNITFVCMQLTTSGFLHASEQSS